MVSLHDFQNIELRVGEVTAAERVPGTGKLLRLTLDLGDEARQTVAGIGESYEPEKLIGRQLVVVSNLEPAVIRGIRSEGMILAVGERGADIVLIAPERPVQKGMRVR
jgi:methionine--tRNA ligase beta chain